MVFMLHKGEVMLLIQCFSVASIVSNISTWDVVEALELSDLQVTLCSNLAKANY